MSKKKKSTSMEPAGSPRPKFKDPSHDKAYPGLQSQSAHNTDLSLDLDGDQFRDWIVQQLSAGLNVPQMAGLLAGEDKKRAKQLRGRIRRLMKQDHRLNLKIHEAARMEANMGLIPAVKGLADRAARGRPDAVKPLMAVTKFHDPSVKHEHSGEIKISIDMPRPVKVNQEDGSDGEVIDADVVEEIISPE